MILSTIHSAKGQEWDSVYLLNAADGCISSDMATGDDAQIEEERRLLYVGMTRAKNRLDLIHPLRPPPPFASASPANAQTSPPAVDMVAALSSMWQ